MSFVNTELSTRKEWDAAKALEQELDGFTAYELGSKLGVDVKLAYPIINGWREQGMAYMDGKRVGRNLYRTSAKGEPKFRDRLSSSRSLKPLEQMWFAMRRLKVFSHLDIQMNANTTKVCVTQNDARKYCQLLAEAGYLRVKRKATKVKIAQYQLIKDTGPIAPKERKVKAIYDENLGDHTYIKGVIEA